MYQLRCAVIGTEDRRLFLPFGLSHTSSGHCTCSAMELLKSERSLLNLVCDENPTLRRWRLLQALAALYERQYVTPSCHQSAQQDSQMQERHSAKGTKHLHRKRVYIEAQTHSISGGTLGGIFAVRGRTRLPPLRSRHARNPQPSSRTTFQGSLRGGTNCRTGNQDWEKSGPDRQVPPGRLPGGAAGGVTWATEREGGEGCTAQAVPSVSWRVTIHSVRARKRGRRASLRNCYLASPKGGCLLRLRQD